MDGRLNQLFYADDTVLIGNSREDLQRLLDVFDIVCKRIKLKINMVKIKVMVCRRTERGEFGLEPECRVVGGVRFV